MKSIPWRLRINVMIGLSVPIVALAGNPPWWAERDVVITNAAATNDYAAVLEGQVKWVAEKAAEELNEYLPGGAGPAVSNQIQALSQTNNYGLVNAGQLKNLVAPLYDRLIEEGYTNSYPWTTNSIADDDDYSLVNVGQVKFLFSFDLRLDADEDGMPDWWERHHQISDPDADADGDGLLNLQEYLNRLDPGDPDFDGDGLPDGWEVQYGIDPRANNANEDPDGDGVNNLVEYLQGRDPIIGGALADSQGLVNLEIYTLIE